MDTELPVEIRNWIEEAKKALLDQGVKIDLQDSELIEFQSGEFCSGYFEDDCDGDIVFACAMKRHWTQWFPIFVHEFCHFEQWRDRREWWNSLKVDDFEGLDLVLEHWAGEREATPTQVIAWCMMSAAAELDCERRVLEKIATYRFPLDPKDYAKKANSYVAFYYAMPELGGWCNGERPYEVPEIMDLMPDHLDLSQHEYWNLAAAAMDLYRKHCLHAKPDGISAPNPEKGKIDGLE